MYGATYLGTKGELPAMEPCPYQLEVVLRGLRGLDIPINAAASQGDIAAHRGILVSREGPIYGADGQVWWIDHVYLDPEGVPTIVEVKRGSNTQYRREAG